MVGPAAGGGIDVIDLSTGQVLDPVPDSVRAAVNSALTGPDATAYAPGPGTVELRRAVAAHYAGRTGRAADPAGVTAVPGVRAGLFAAVSAVARGRDVLVPAPYWSHYPRLLELAGARAVVAAGDAEDGWRVDVERLERVRTRDTAALLLNTPVNPTGATYDAGRLAGLRDWSVAAGVRVIHDDVYWAYADVDALRSGVDVGDLVVGGISKSHALAGLRVGWVWAPTDLSAAVRDVVEHTVGPTCTASQAAAAAALAEGAATIAPRARRLAERLALATRVLGSVPLLRPVPARAGIYLCLDVSDLLARAPWGATDDVALCASLTSQVGVRLRPGSTFGLPGHVRLCVAVRPDVLHEAARRLTGWLSRFDC